MKLIVGVTGASGVEMSYRLLQALSCVEGCEVHLVVSEAAHRNWDLEMDLPFDSLTGLAAYVYRSDDLAAPISSGSFLTDGMIIMPCSMKTLAGIVTGYSDNLILRAADVCLKEGRALVLVPRETPLGRVHLQNLCKASELGCAIVPPMLTFYNHARSIEAQIDHIIGKVFMQFGLEPVNFTPWLGVEGGNMNESL